MTVQLNIDKLNSFKELKSGWNGKESDPIPSEFINTALSHIEKFLVQPIITPYDNGIALNWPLPDNNLIEMELSDQIELVVWINEDISVDQVIESKFISQYVNRILKQQLINAQWTL